MRKKKNSHWSKINFIVLTAFQAVLELIYIAHFHPELGTLFVQKFHTLKPGLTNPAKTIASTS